MRIYLKSINKLLRFFGLCLVVSYHHQSEHAGVYFDLMTLKAVRQWYFATQPLLIPPEGEDFDLVHVGPELETL